MVDLEMIHFMYLVVLTQILQNTIYNKHKTDFITQMMELYTNLIQMLIMEMLVPTQEDYLTLVIYPITLGHLIQLQVCGVQTQIQCLLKEETYKVVG